MIVLGVGGEKVAVAVAVADVVVGGGFLAVAGGGGVWGRGLSEAMVYVDHSQFNQIRRGALTHRIDRLTLGGGPCFEIVTVDACDIYVQF